MVIQREGELTLCFPPPGLTRLRFTAKPFLSKLRANDCCAVKCLPGYMIDVLASVDTDVSLDVAGWVELAWGYLE